MMNLTRRTLAVLSLLAAFGSALAQTSPPTDAPPTPDAPSRPQSAPDAGTERRPMATPGDDLRWVLQPRVRTELGLTSLQIEKIRALLPDPAERPGRLGGPDGRRGPGRLGRPGGRILGDRGPVGSPGEARPPENGKEPAGGPGNAGGGAGTLPPQPDRATPPPVADPGSNPGVAPVADPGARPPVDAAGAPAKPRLGTERRGSGPVRTGDAKALESQLRSILRPVQFERYRQLRLQRERLGSLTRDGFASELGLTASQREKLDRMLGRSFEFEETEPGAGAPGDLPPAGAPPEDGRPEDGRPLPPDGAGPQGGGSVPPPAVPPRA